MTSHKGRVKFYNRSGEFGFIISDRFDRDIYFKFDNVANKDEIDVGSLGDSKSTWMASFSDVDSNSRGFEAASVVLEDITDVLSGSKILQATDDTDAVVYLNNEDWFNVACLELSGHRKLEFMVGKNKEVLARIVRS